MSEWVCERESMNEYVSVCDSVLVNVWLGVLEKEKERMR